ncbi:MAG: beta-ketoacyl synthase chain length factor [Myxococcota bacterium]|jgi:hypothetical protein|nr:beta-ketoacyl synthase chain length factor [Myxococcota bacterium]
MSGQPSMPAVYLHGRGLWSPGIPDVAAYLARREDPSAAAPADSTDRAERPACDVVHPRMKRATSLLTQTSIEVMTQAARDAGFALDQCATVFGSEHGEIQIAVEQMQMMQEGSGIVSPARFKNSVHNTAAGLFSISVVNRGFTTAIAAGEHTFAMSLLEAWMLLADGDVDQVVVSIAEEPLPTPIHDFAPHVALGVALALGTKAEGALAKVGAPERRRVENGIEVPSRFAGHPGEGALRLLEAVRPMGRAASVTDVALSSAWSVRVEPLDAAGRS